MLNNNEYLDKLYQSDKSIIIYKNDNGFDVYTDFSKKIIVDKKNIKKFLNTQSKEKSSSIDGLNCYIGFFGYKLLCDNIGIKLPKQKTTNFYSGLFYKPKTKINYLKFSIQHISKNT